LIVFTTIDIYGISSELFDYNFGAFNFGNVTSKTLAYYIVTPATRSSKLAFSQHTLTSTTIPHSQ